MAVRIKGLIEEIGKAGWPTEAILPILIKVMPAMYDAVVKTFRKQIVATERRRARAAVEGIYHWLIYANRFSIPGPPKDLLYELGNIVQGRRQPALDWALQYVTQIIVEAPEQIDAVFIECLCRGLEFLLQETDYRGDNGTPQRTLEFEKMPFCRELCAKLASALNKTSYANDYAVQEWLKAAQDDPLPEVRYALVTS